jgi:hypothetical protein
MRHLAQAVRCTTSPANVGPGTRSSLPTLPGSHWDQRSRPSTYLSFFGGGPLRDGSTDDPTSPSNPALCSRNFPPAPAFSNPHAIRAGVLRGWRGKPSWADGRDPMKHEYAVTASEGSGGGH